jgi:hypothetical protein
MQKLSISIIFAACSGINLSSNAAPPENVDLQKFMSERDESNYTYPTKFGNIKLVREDGSPAGIGAKVTLNGQTLIDVTRKQDLQGNWISLMYGSTLTGDAIEQVPRKKGQQGRVLTKRMIVFQGPDGNCIKGFTILDFTGEQPYISEKFGYNPEDKYCFTLKKVKWGKEESYFYLQGPATYIYYTGGRAFGPIE